MFPEGTHVQVFKKSGENFTGTVLRYEGETCVVKPDDGSCVEKRAFYGERVTQTQDVIKNKYDISNIGESDKVRRWKAKFGEMTE